MGKTIAQKIFSSHLVESPLKEQTFLSLTEFSAMKSQRQSQSMTLLSGIKTEFLTAQKSRQS